MTQTQEPASGAHALDYGGAEPAAAAVGRLAQEHHLALAAAARLR